MIHCISDTGFKDDLRHVTVTGIVINDQDKILLIKRAAHLNNPNKWALPGGYLNRGERTSQGVLREILEESGYQGEVISLFYLNDNPNRPQEDTMNVEFLFLVKPRSQVQEPDKEVQEVKWFDLNALPSKDQFAFDHYEDIQLYIEHRKNPSVLPLFSIYK